MMKILTGWFLIIVGVVALAAATLAEVPHLINYQGTITDANGPVDGTHDLTFAIYPDSLSSTVLWTEYHPEMNMRYGLFSVILGRFNYIPNSLFDNDELWIGVKIDDDPEIAPRMRITAVAWSLRAAVADTSLALPEHSHYFLDAADGDPSEAVYVDNGGNVGIGTTGPSEKLDVIGTLKMTGFKMPTGASSGYMLVSDDSGVGTWTEVVVGNITEVYADDGLTGGGTSEEVHISVGAGDGINASPDQVSVYVNDFEGAGLTESGGDIHVNPGTGLEISGDVVQLDSDYSDGSAYDSRFVNENQADAITNAMILNGTIQFEDIGQNSADSNEVMKWNGSAWVAAPDAGGNGDITSVYADDGLTGGATENDAHISIGEGDGVHVYDDSIGVDVTDFDGSGLGVEGINDLKVNAGTGLEISGDEVQLESQYLDGSAYDARFVNEDQADAVSSGMIQDATIQLADIGQNGADEDQVMKWNGSAWQAADDEKSEVGIFPKPVWDSKWKWIPGGSDSSFTHNVGGDPNYYFVYILLKDNNGLGIHNRGYGADTYFEGPDYKTRGAYFYELNASTIKVRHHNGIWADSIRVRIWRIQ